MKIYAKSLQLGEKVNTLKVDNASYASKAEADLDTKAVYALLGGYNQVARGVDLNTFAEIKKKFHYLVDELADLIKHAEDMAEAAKLESHNSGTLTNGSLR